MISYPWRADDARMSQIDISKISLKSFHFSLSCFLASIALFILFHQNLPPNDRINDTAIFVIGSRKKTKASIEAIFAIKNYKRTHTSNSNRHVASNGRCSRDTIDLFVIQFTAAIAKYSFYMTL